MSIQIIPASLEHIAELSRICFEAFGTLHDRHGVERDFDCIETAMMVITMVSTRPDFTGFVATDAGKIVGSNFISFSDPISGVGPITVDPACQSQGIGRLLMQAVIEEARGRGVTQLRLIQEAVNTASLSLYTKLGFDWRECCVLFKPAPAAEADSRTCPVTRDDLLTIDAISKKHYGESRVNEVDAYLSMQMPGMLIERDGLATGYFFGGLFGHGFAETPDDLATLISQTTRIALPPFQKCIVPLGDHALHRALMSTGGRAVKMLNYMSMGPYSRPTGSWVPSIGM